MYVRVGLTSHTKTPMFRGLVWVAHIWESSTIWSAQVSSLAFSCSSILVKKSYWWCAIITSPTWFFWTPNCTSNDTDCSQQTSNKCTQRFLQGMPNQLLQCAHLLLSQLNGSLAFHHLIWHLQIHTKTISLTQAAKFHPSYHLFCIAFPKWSVHSVWEESAELSWSPVTLAYRQKNAHPSVHPLLCCLIPWWFSDALLIWNIFSVFLLSFLRSPGTGLCYGCS